VALDAGTTVLELCKFLCKKQDLIVISNDIHSSAELLSAGNNKIYMMGGFLTPDGTSSGTFAKEFLNNIAGIDVFIFSTDGASLEDGLSTDEASINDVKKLYIKKAKKRIAMIDHSKFSKRAFYKMCDFIDIDVLVTDSETPSDIIQKLRRLGTQVDIVEIPRT
jgi:DeoR/GlpR family transcriptional regulator of sugar metabolism